MQEIPVRFLGREDPLEKGVGYPLQYSWASLVAQLGKNPPALGGTWIRSLGGEDPLEKGTTIHSSILAWRIIGHGVTKSRTLLSNFHFSLRSLSWGLGLDQEYGQGGSPPECTISAV